MKNKTRIFYLLWILIFITIFFIVKDNLNKIFPKKTAKIFSTIKKEQIKEIEIETNDKKIKIYKKNNQWLTKKDNTEFNADKERVEKIIEAFLNLEKEETASTNPKNFKNLGIDKQKITIATDSNKHSVYIGNSPSFEKNYLKINSEKRFLLQVAFLIFCIPMIFAI
jgi:ribosomal protein L31